MVPKYNDGLTKGQRWRQRHPERIKRFERTISGRYSALKTAAKIRGHEMTITYDEYAVLISQLCFYCGGKLPEVGHGIDRVNSDIGYTQGNVRPCCTHCNRAKSSMTETEFKEWSLKLFNHWGGK